MGVTATFMVLADAISKAQTFVNAFVSVYPLLILLYIVASWLRLPYSPWLNRIQRLLSDASAPYPRPLRPLLPSTGPRALSPLTGTTLLRTFGQVLPRIPAQSH